MIMELTQALLSRLGVFYKSFPVWVLGVEWQFVPIADDFFLPNNPEFLGLFQQLQNCCNASILLATHSQFKSMTAYLGNLMLAIVWIIRLKY